VTLCFNGLAANPPVSSLGLNQLKESNSIPGAQSTNQPVKGVAGAQEQHGNLTLLKQDSGTNISKMNLTFSISPTYGSSQAVKFTAPKAGWKLKGVLIMATDGWNSSSKEVPMPLPFAVEIRDANLALLYHYSDAQLSYFTSATGIRMASIELPDVPVSGDFFVCFYGYRLLGLATELDNATGNSYYFERLTGFVYPGALSLKNNKTLPVNWIIRAVGQ
jgi:hypothetical protein